MPPETHTLSLHDALPISLTSSSVPTGDQVEVWRMTLKLPVSFYVIPFNLDRKSTRLNSSHVSISYAVSCLIKRVRRLRRKNKKTRSRSAHSASCYCSGVP